jgi:hypothetical protein
MSGSDGWDQLEAVLTVAREIDTGLHGTGITPSELRARSDRLAELALAWKRTLDAQFASGEEDPS